MYLPRCAPTLDSSSQNEHPHVSSKVAVLWELGICVTHVVKRFPKRLPGQFLPCIRLFVNISINPEPHHSDEEARITDITSLRHVFFLNVKHPLYQNSLRFCYLSNTPSEINAQLLLIASSFPHSPLCLLWKSCIS